MLQNAKRFLALLSLLTALASAPAKGALVTYKVTVTTTSVTGQSADMEMQFNPPNTNNPVAYATVQYFTTDGTLNPGIMDIYEGSFGDVSNSLPGTVYFLNGETNNPVDDFNCYCENITFGTYISFYVTFSGPAMTNYSVLTQDIFSLDFINPATGTYVLSHDPTGHSDFGWIAGLIGIAGNGAAVTVSPVAGPGSAAEAPELQPNTVVPAVVAFASASSVPPSPPLNIQKSGPSIILSWTNSVFSLQAATNLTGVFTNVPGATSPYTNAVSAAGQFFRLDAP